MSEMINLHRGECLLKLRDRDLKLCLTLQSLAELESSYQISSISQLLHRFAKGSFSSKDILAILAAGLRGAGHDQEASNLASLPFADGISGAIETAVTLIERNFTTSDK